MFGNFLQTLAQQNPTIDPVGQSAFPWERAQPATQAPQTTNIEQPRQEAPRRERRSFLDTIGRISDVIAKVGGADPLYGPTIQANEDRQRQIELADLNKQALEQGVQAGEGELQNTERSRLATALGGIAENPESANLWPQIAQEAGIDPQRATAIGQLLERNPAAAKTLAQSLGWKPEINRQGTAPKELQIYGLLNQQDPELARTFLENLVNPKALTPYQKAQLDLRLQQFGFEREKYYNPQPSAAQRTADSKAETEAVKRQGALSGALEFLDTLDQTVEALNASGGMANQNQSGEQSLLTAAKANLPLIERVTSPEGFAAREQLDGLLTHGVLGLLPLLSSATIGSKNFDAAKEMENLRKSVASAKSYEAAKAAIERFRKNIQRQLNTAPSTSAARPSAGRRIVPNSSRGSFGNIASAPNANPAAIAEARRRGLIK